VKKDLYKKLALAAAKAKKHGDDFRILAVDCEHWSRQFEFHDATCSHKENSKKSCNPISCPLRKE